MYEPKYNEREREKKIHNIEQSVNLFLFFHHHHFNV